MRKLHLTVFPNGRWMALDDYGATLGRGSWVKSRREVVTALVEPDYAGVTAKEKRRDEMLTRAVVAGVHALGAVE